MLFRSAPRFDRPEQLFAKEPNPEVVQPLGELATIHSMYSAKPAPITSDAILGYANAA